MKLNFRSFLCPTKETNQKKVAKTMLPPALPECNGQCKRVGNKRLLTNLPNGLIPKRQALLLLSVNIRAFTVTPARRFECPTHNFRFQGSFSFYIETHVRRQENLAVSGSCRVQDCV